MTAVLSFALLSACGSTLPGYGVGPQAERQAEIQQATRDPAPDTPSVYLDLIGRMQAQGLYYASLAHIDAFEKQYGAQPDTILMRADALRMTDQPAAAAEAYTKLLQTPLAARGYRGLGLIAGAAGDFGSAVQQLQDAARLAPTDPATLSDLGYAELREGDINGARVPLMKAAQLDHSNPKIISNVVLYLLADGDTGRAATLMDQQKFSPGVRAAIRRDADKVAAAGRAQQRRVQLQQDSRDSSNAPIASAQGVEPAPRLLQRFSQ
ncbi:tetratricopeptide repeat protein [Paraburkholderia sp. GAS41]|jgi:Flp pilus assembly protein TadD|uniref:tetratricopeptide repeat protein n=1 Tax=Paraburkholderia sp. GAS41 TaxID=3035134 RepID=UPI003D2155FB